MMEVPFSLEIIVTVALFMISGVGAVIAYFLSELKNEIEKMRESLDITREQQGVIETRVGIIETKMGLCKHCPNDGGT